MGKVRTKRVMVRLAPGREAAPDEVRFFTEEKAVVERVRKGLGYKGISTFIRELGVSVAAKSVDGKGLDDYQVVKTAANQCALPLGEWLRLVVLAGVEFTPLEDHLVAAREAMAALVKARGK